jgi:hypothetical protein
LILTGIPDAPGISGGRIEALRRRNHVPDTFQLGAISQFLAVLAPQKINKFRFLNQPEYSDSCRRHNLLNHCDSIMLFSSSLFVHPTTGLLSEPVRMEARMGIEPMSEVLQTSP